MIAPWTTNLVSIGFNHFQVEQNIYICKEGTIYLIIGVYVNDLPITSNCITSMHGAINQLKEKFLVEVM